MLTQTYVFEGVPGCKRVLRRNQDLGSDKESSSQRCDAPIGPVRQLTSAPFIWTWTPKVNGDKALTSNLSRWPNADSAFCPVAWNLILEVAIGHCNKISLDSGKDGDREWGLRLSFSRWSKYMVF